MHGFFVNEIPPPGATAALEKGEHRHLFRTLRGRPGERLRLLDGRGGVAEAVIAAGETVEVEAVRQMPEPELKIILAAAAPRRQKLDELLKQLVELGVWEIQLMHCARSVARPEGSERWPALLAEAAKQSGNPFLPTIAVRDSPAAVLAELTARRTAIRYGAVSEAAGMPPAPARGEIAFLVGPEGGFTAEEERAIEAAGGRALSLGPWILRLETAALAGVAALRAVAARME